MKKLFLLFIISFSHFTGISQEQKILFIGNSLTYYYGLPGMVKQMAEAKGKEVFIEQQTPGGVSLDEHIERLETIEKINEHQWDYVILQGSHFHIAFPEYHYYIEPPIEGLKEIILANNPNTKIIFFMDWALKYGNNFNGSYYTYDVFQDMIISGTLILADKYNFIVSPIGRAWKTVVEGWPALELYDPDLGHPSHYGSYLEACVYFVTIFKETIVGYEYSGRLSRTKTMYLQEVASNTVLNDLELWNISNYTSTTSERVQKNQLCVYPNPVTSILNIKVNTSNGRNYLTLRDVKSNVIFFAEEVENSREIQINMLSCPDGIYFLEIRNSKEISVFKIVKK